VKRLTERKRANIRMALPPEDNHGQKKEIDAWDQHPPVNKGMLRSSSGLSIETRKGRAQKTKGPGGLKGASTQSVG